MKMWLIFVTLEDGSSALNTVLIFRGLLILQWRKSEGEGGRHEEEEDEEEDEEEKEDFMTGDRNKAQRADCLAAYSDSCHGNKKSQSLLNLIWACYVQSATMSPTKNSNLAFFPI